MLTQIGTILNAMLLSKIEHRIFHITYHSLSDKMLFNTLRWSTFRRSFLQQHEKA